MAMANGIGFKVVDWFEQVSDQSTVSNQHSRQRFCSRVVEPSPRELASIFSASPFCDNFHFASKVQLARQEPNCRV
jgi:hypothetical protein